MIEYIYGNLILKSPNYCIIDINGMGYKVNITNNGFDKLSNINTKVKLLIYFSVSENSQALFGFFDATERDLFLMLISISGIGPKTAINMLSSVTPQEFKDRLIAGEVKMLTMIPGVGPKTARRIIVELKDKFVDSDNNDLPLENNSKNMDAYHALKNLGYQSSKINHVLNEIFKSHNDLETQEIIKKALQLMK